MAVGGLPCDSLLPLRGWSGFAITRAMSDAMTRFGVGPRFTVLTVCLLIVTTGLRLIWPTVFRIDLVPYPVLVILAAILIAIGLPFYVLAVVAVMRAFDGGKLCTTGVYRCCRHPVYASWVVFLVPAIGLLADSWIGLSVPIVMYILLRWLVREEDAYLDRMFGEDYRRYRRQVPTVLPMGWLRPTVKDP